MHIPRPESTVSLKYKEHFALAWEFAETFDSIPGMISCESNGYCFCILKNVENPTFADMVELYHYVEIGIYNWPASNSEPTMKVGVDLGIWPEAKFTSAEDRMLELIKKLKDVISSSEPPSSMYFGRTDSPEALYSLPPFTSIAELRMKLDLQRKPNIWEVIR